MKSLLIILFTICLSKAEESKVPTVPENTPSDFILTIRLNTRSENITLVLNQDQSKKIMNLLRSEGTSLEFKEPPISGIIESRDGRQACPIFTCPRGTIYLSKKGEENSDLKKQEIIAFLDEKMSPLHFTLLDLYSQKTKEKIREQLLSFPSFKNLK